MYVKDFFVVFDVRIVNSYVLVKMIWMQQCWVQYVFMVGCGQNDYVFVGFKIVYFDKQLVECLFMFVIVVVIICVMMVIYGVDFVDEYDIRCVFFGLFKYVLDMGGIYIYEYFNKVRIRNGEEWYICFICNCVC